jgi:hypothetical protein
MTGLPANGGSGEAENGVVTWPYAGPTSMRRNAQVKAANLIETDILGKAT